MKAVLMGPKGTTFAIEAVPNHIRLGWIEIPKQPKLLLIEVAYELPDLLAIAPLLRVMQEVKCVPQVFLWQEASQEPDVLVVFEVTDPAPASLERVIGDNALSAVLKEKKSTRMLTVAAANTDKETMQQFLGFFGRLKQATVIVTEATSGYSHESILVDPVQMFDVRLITQEKPDLQLL